jgi:type II secretory ATPase GspE/PulE/Tfp pilus assembly ATPase PilB-like protein
MTPNPVANHDPASFWASPENWGDTSVASMPSMPPAQNPNAAGSLWSEIEPSQRFAVPMPEAFATPAAPAYTAPLVQPVFSAASSMQNYNLEEQAMNCGLPPVKLPRNACSIPAENLLRTFGAPSRSAQPWLPLGSLGPLLIMGHFDPNSQDYWSVPSFLIVRVLIQPAQYDTIYQDLLSRLSHKPLPPQNPNSQLQPPPRDGGLKPVVDWFVNDYPMPDVEREKLKKLLDERGSKPYNGLEDLKFLPRHYGVAILALQTPGLSVYNPEEAPGQTVFPDSLLEKHNVFPLHCTDSHVWLLSAVPSTYAFEDEWLSSGHDAIRITNILADPSAISTAIARNRSRGSRDSGAPVQVGELTYSDNQNIIEIDPLDMAKVNPANPNTAPDELVKWVIYRAITMRGSDLHIEKFYNTARFRARIDGELVVIHSCSEEGLLRYIAIIKNWSNMAQERQTTQDGRFSMRLGKKRIDVRVAAVPHRKEFQKIIMRFLDKQDGIKKLSELNMSTRQSSIIKQVLGRDQGLALVTGPTGSGKTTTLYAFLNAINEDNINIQTIEDPIEYEIEGINQTQTDPFHGLDFPTGLRSLLRADPDVILIGESRDSETAGAAVNAALTGHLVLTTLHANDSLRAISRLLSMGIEPYLLADALALSQAQRLVRRLCPYCKAPLHVTQEIQDFLHHHGAIETAITEPLYQKVGCDECNGTGYSGRIALMEMCLITNELSGLIAEGAPVVQMRKIAVQGGFKSLYQEGLVQVAAGNTTFDEINCLSYTAMG